VILVIQNTAFLMVMKECLCSGFVYQKGSSVFYIPGTSVLEVIENTWQIKNKKY
jgi:hypothetical protein